MIYGMTNEELIKELNTCRMAQAVMDNTVADLEAKLAKALGVLEIIVLLDNTDEGLGVYGRLAHSTLAELKVKNYV